MKKSLTIKMKGWVSFLLIGLFLPFQMNGQPTEEDILASIELGTTWLVNQQNPDGSWGTWAGGSLESQRVAYTAFALTKLCDRAYEHFYDSPFDPAYEYHQNVIDGFNFMFNHAKTHGAGTGIYFLEGTYDHHEVYNASIALMAFASTYIPNRVINAPGNALINNKTFEYVVDEMVTYFAWAQNTNGGWRYQPNSPDSDNSHTGYVVLGLRYAEAFGAILPAGVKNGLDSFIDYIQNDVNGDTHDGGSGYEIPNNWVNQLKTGNLLFEMHFCGDPSATQRVQDALDYIERHWDDPNPDPGWKYNIQSMFCLMKGFESYDIETIEVGSVDRNWFEEFATYLVNNQYDDGHWHVGVSFSSPLLNTVWALFVLEKVVPNAPPVAVCQNLEAFADENCEGWAEAADFDNGSYDPDYEDGDDPLTFSVNPPAPYPLGITAVTLTVTDPDGDSDQCAATITVLDNTPPVPDVDPLPDLVGECDVEVPIPTATDNCAGVLQGTTDDPLSYTEQGNYTITWTYDDGNGNTTTQQQAVIVDDVTPPVITTLEEPQLMWPPNHKYETFLLEDFVLGVSDNCVDLSIDDINFTFICSDEPEDVNGNGDGKTFDDMIIADDCKSVQLRKERQGKGNGRVYSLYMELDDGNGNITEAIAWVHVQHSPVEPAFNDGAVYWEYGNCYTGGKSAVLAEKNWDSNNFELSNYPNPFTGTTTINFSLNTPKTVTLLVYNSLGQKVATLYNGFAEAGQEYSKEFNGNYMPQGLYICVLKSEGKVLMKRTMMFAK